MSESRRRLRRVSWSVFWVAVLAFIAWPGPSYFGLCYSQARFLSEREKIDAAIEDTIASYPPILASLGNHAPKDPIPYTSVAEFRRINPDCCSLSNSARNAPDVSFLSRLKGTNSTYVLVNYLVRFTDQHGNVVTEPASTFAAITNCGYPWSGY